MDSAVQTRFNLKPVVAAVTLALASAVFAAPTPNQMPGAGTLTTLGAGAALQVNGGGAIPVTTPIINLASGSRIDLTLGNAVITWGGAGAPVDATNPSGFNLGSSALLQFGSVTANTAVLNIDASGNASQIFGNLEATALPWAGCLGCAFAPAIFVANGNGIVVGAGGRIAAPSGLGLIGANLNNATAKNDFVANNGALNSFIDVTTGQSTVTVNGAINGSLTVNAPAAYVLLAGGDIVNTGNVFTSAFYAVAGLRSTASTDTVNGVANTTVNRLFDVTGGNEEFLPVIGTLPGLIEIANAASTFINTGSISTDTAGGIAMLAAAGVRSGTAGDTNPLVGLFSDGIIIADTYTSAGKVELYNTVSGYTTNKSLQGVFINTFSGPGSSTQGEVIINALTPGTQASSISTIDDVIIFGTDIKINSTINHKLTSAGSAQVDPADLVINSSKSVTITADIGAATDVEITNTGAGGISISGNVIGDSNKGGAGGIFIINSGKASPTVISGNLTSYGDDILVDVTGPLTISGNANAVGDDVAVINNGTASGNTTTISGNLTAGDSYVEVYNYGTLSSNLNISGTLTSPAYVYVYSGGNLQLGKVDAGYQAYITVDGLSSMLNGPVTAGDYLYYYGSAATTKAKPAAVLTSPYVYVEALTFQGVNASGAAYANVGEKPSAQIVTNSLELYLYGSFNAPIVGNTNWLTNQIQVEALDPLSQVGMSISAMGAGFQAINIGVTGNAWVESGDTYTPFNAVGLTTGTTTAGGLIGNGGSQLIVNASGTLDIYAGNISSFFEFPGGIAFKSGSVLTQFVPVYNAWTLEALPYQGVFFEAPTINALSYIATNGNSWANWSVKPVAGAPTIYQITQPAPTTFGFVANASAAHLNTYSLLITGTPVNTCPGFPPVCN